MYKCKNVCMYVCVIIYTHTLYTYIHMFMYTLIPPIQQANNTHAHARTYISAIRTDLFNRILWSEKIMKLRFVQFSRLQNLPPLKPQFLRQHSILELPQQICFLKQIILYQIQLRCFSRMNT